MRHLFSCTFLALLGLPVPLRAESSDVKPVTVPFELLKTKHMAVMIKLNGKGPYRVIFDTGAPVTILNNKVAKESGLTKDLRKPVFSLFGAMGQVSIKALEVGDLKAEGVSAIVMDHPTVQAISQALGPVEGIVGFPFFARYKMTLDYQAKQMTFVPSGYDPPDAMQEMMAAILSMASDKKPVPSILAPAGQWGLVVHKEAGDEGAGVTIKKVLVGSASASAGLQIGDRLLTIDGRWTDTVADCYAAAAQVKPGAAVSVVIQRNGKEKEHTVKPVAGL